jgi:hypothetical protein
MTNVEKLSNLSTELLGDIRQAFGATGPNDPGADYNIDKATPEYIVAQWSWYKLGSSYWYLQMQTIEMALKQGL